MRAGKLSSSQNGCQRLKIASAGDSVFNNGLPTVQHDEEATTTPPVYVKHSGIVY